MKRLFIIRHTKKDRESSNEYDYDIELTEEGKQKATVMAKELAKSNPNIDLIVASPAIRTRQTAEIFAKELNYDKTIMLNEVLYMAFVNEMIETITYTYDTVDSMILVGHNPSLTALAITLVGFKEKFEEGAIMQIDFDCNSWIDIDKTNATMVSYKK
ncbi:SixA phosphatase family protein [Aliarcobacter lanthieri]|uniref:SixA phosphatase family protein n=1 Tax=Arcobacteraceae TaxID=2808963 RepID=UPI000DEBA025|nr:MULTISPECIES: histidine phosphatase family protein [Arcobacteraceae]MBL3520802.1 histidine phosphatase family protein [Aliarcobacter lanthieri]RBQ27778.1 phosphoglycerate mutase [Arcobacter sp. CECT 9188]